jgi:hypothetical protein
MLASVTCTRCKDVVDVPDDVRRGHVTNYCRCGLTYVTKGVGFTQWGGPGKPQEREHDKDDVSWKGPDVVIKGFVRGGEFEVVNEGPTTIEVSQLVRGPGIEFKP